MPLTINLRHLEKQNLALKGELEATELDLEAVDELIQVVEPVQYDLEVERIAKDILVRGSITLTLECQCARCLKSFKQSLQFDHWTCDLPLEGEERVAVENDCVDLTPYIREDILLAFPQHPLCDIECRGLKYPSQIQSSSGARKTGESSSAWAELNKLKFSDNH